MNGVGLRANTLLRHRAREVTLSVVVLCRTVSDVQHRTTVDRGGVSVVGVETELIGVVAQGVVRIAEVLLEGVAEVGGEVL